jgi:hypothetical protein
MGIAALCWAVRGASGLRLFRESHAPAEVAARFLHGPEADEEDIFPDPNSRAMAGPGGSGPNVFELAIAAA